MYSKRAEEDSEKTCRDLRLCVGVYDLLRAVVCRVGISCISAAIYAKRRVFGKLISAILAIFRSVSDRNSAMDTYSGEVIDFISAIFAIHIFFLSYIENNLTTQISPQSLNAYATAMMPKSEMRKMLLSFLLLNGDISVITDQ